VTRRVELIPGSPRADLPLGELACPRERLRDRSLEAFGVGDFDQLELRRQQLLQFFVLELPQLVELALVRHIAGAIQHDHDHLRLPHPRGRQLELHPRQRARDDDQHRRRRDGGRQRRAVLAMCTQPLRPAIADPAPKRVQVVEEQQADRRPRSRAHKRPLGGLEFLTTTPDYALPWTREIARYAELSLFLLPPKAYPLLVARSIGTERSVWRQRI
jgi:hypothetical protein